MNIIESIIPLNTKEKIDQLMAIIMAEPKAMNKNTWLKINENINKAKVQMYFYEKYPQSQFSAPGNYLPSCQGENQKQEDKKPQTQPSVKNPDIPIPIKSLREDRYIYATYIEMAFHNMFLNIKHIYGVVFGRDIMAEAKENFIGERWEEDFAHESLVWNPMFEAFEKANVEEKLKVTEMLERHFPLLVPFKDFTAKDAKYKDYTTIDILRRLSKVLRVLRNFYSHYRIELFENQKKDYLYNENLVIRCTMKSYEGARRVIKDRYSYDEKDMKCTNQYQYEDERGRRLREKVEIKGFRYKIAEKGNDSKLHFTPFGLVAFISLFLEKKYSKILTDKLRLIPQQDQHIINEMLAVYRIRLNAQKLNITKGADLLALDIINELQRCPKDLFSLLSPSVQRKFRHESENHEEVLMVRHSDRFPFLIMKYIDNCELFNNIRFQVSLGKYFYKFYNKNCIDSETRVRALSKNVNGFGRLADIDKKREENWKDYIRLYDDVHKNTVDEKPYVTDHHAQYVINGNRIAMRIIREEGKRFLPELGTDEVRNLAPTCWLSIYDLSSMAFLIYLTNGEFVEGLIEQTIENYHKLFKDIENGILLPVANEEELDSLLSKNYGGIKQKDIPQNMLDYLLRKTKDARKCFVEFSQGMIDKMISQTEYKIEQIKRQEEQTKQNKIGKKSYVVIKDGRLASFLAKDIMLFQPNNSENSNKLTGLNFRILQSTLACLKTYGIDQLKRTLTSANIIGNTNDESCNPIVMKMMRKRLPDNTRDFYKSYLRARLEYLDECKRKADYDNLYFLHANRSRWQEHDDEFCRLLAGRYLHDKIGGTEFEKSINLPSGMFDKFIREKLCDEYPSLKDIANDETKNISYLIYAYFKNVCKDDCLSFYEASRSYRLFKVLGMDKAQTAQDIRLMLNRKHNTSVYKKIEKYLNSIEPSLREQEKAKLSGLLREMKNSETDFKRFKIQDILLFLIAKKLFEDNKKDDVQSSAFKDLKLKHLMDDEGLSKKIEIKVKVKSRNEYEKVITKSSLKLKNYADFYKLFNDHRLPALLDLVYERSIDYDSINDEFSGYDKVRPNVMKDVLNYERGYYDSHADSDIPLDFGSMLLDDSSFDDEQKDVLRKIRNSFAHNTYPKHYIVSKAGDPHLPDKAVKCSEKFNKDINNE